MQQHYLTKSFNRLTFVLCLFILVICARELFFLPLELRSTSSLFEIGKVENIHNTSAIRKYDEFTWNNASNGEILNAKDLIFTHKNSTAQLSVNENKIKVLEETMIQLEGNDQLQVTNGNIELTLNNNERPLRVLVKDKVFILRSRGAKVLFEKSENEEVKISVKEGNVVVSLDKSTKTFSLNEKQTLSYDGKESQLSSSNIMGIYPINEKIISKTRMSKIDFQTKISNLKTATLEIASNREFKDVILTDKDYQGSLLYPLEPGKYFWKVSSEKIESAIYSFEKYFFIDKEIRIKPENEFTEIRYTPESEISFEWKSIEDEPSYTLLISNEIGERVFTKSILGTSFKWETELKGNFFWEVISENPYVQINNRAKMQFSIRDESSSLGDVQIIELSRPNQLVFFEWEKDKSNSSSLFEVATDPAFKKVIITKKLKSSQTETIFPELGTYYWRSFCVDSEGNRKLNRPRKLLIRPTPPPLKPRKLPNLKFQVETKHKKNFWDFLISSAYAQDENEVLLNWPSLDDAKEYEIEIYSDRTHQRLVKKITTTKSNYKWKVPRMGTFYWRYRYVDFWKRFSPFSDTSELVITRKKIVFKSENEKTLKKEKRKNNPNSLVFLVAPSLIDLMQTGSQNFEIDGTALSGFKIQYQFTTKDHNYFDINFENNSGLVFDDEKFLYQNFDAHYNILFESFTLGAGMRVLNIPFYSVKSEDPVFSKMILKNLVDLSAQYFWQKLNILIELSIGFLEASYFEVNLSHEIYKKKAFSLKTQVARKQISFVKGDDETKIEQYQVSIGSEYQF